MKQTCSYPKIRLTKSVRPFFKADFDQCNKTKNITDTESIKVQGGMFKNGLQYSLEFWIPRRGFQIPGTEFQSLSVELGLWIPMVSGILDFLSCIPYSKARIPDSTSKNFRHSGIPISLHLAI